MRPALFISDLHLAATRPELVATFEAFCAGPAREAAAVYVLGDLFDSWIGDAQLREPIARRVVGALRSVTEAGVAVGVMHGNRDFLLGDRFTAQTGARLLPEQVVVDVAGTPTLLLHGDELCTDDVAYQRFRARVRDPRVQKIALATPALVRSGLARVLRSTSRRASMAKPEPIMDVAADAVAAAFRRHRVRRMIHGHTHRPARHELMVDGEARERFVLSDWHDRGSYLAFGPQGPRTHDIPPG